MDTHGWLAFVPREPMLVGFPFDRLARLPQTFTSTSEGTYSLPQEIVDSWARLDLDLLQVTGRLCGAYKIAVIAPYSPWAKGYQGFFKKPHSIKKAAMLSRDWFFVWMGLLSYGVARAEFSLEAQKGYQQWCKDQGKDAILEVPDWRSFLKKPSLDYPNEICFDSTWVDAISASTICDFSINNPRAGIFLKLPNQGPSPRQPSIRWFCERGIPVWYRWGPAEHELAKQSEFYRGLAPLTDNPGIPSLFTDPQHAITLASATAAPARSSGSKSWQEYFADLEKENLERAKVESAKDRERRLNRERQPPTRSAKVIEWVQPINGGNQLIPEEKRVAERVDILEMYEDKYKRYDSFNNTWHICEEFGANQPSTWQELEDYRMFLGNYTDEEREEIEQMRLGDEPPPISNTPLRAPTPPINLEPYIATDLPSDHFQADNNLRQTSSLELLQIGICETLYEHYGLIPPVPIPQSLSKFSEKDGQRFGRWLGLDTDGKPEVRRQFEASDIARLSLQFLKLLIAGQRPSSDYWDLSPSNRESLVFSKRLKSVSLSFFEQIQANHRWIFVFDFKSEATVHWKLAVTTAADVLLVCRLDPRFREADIARFLIERGVPFRTLVWKSIMPSPPLSMPIIYQLPSRGPNYVFSKRDFDSYIHLREMLVRQPRIRAALLRGGMPWRLVISFMHADKVLGGPVGGGPMREVHHPSGDMLVDDDLTDLELDLLCGTYMCDTGM